MREHVEQVYLREILIQADYAILAVQRMNQLLQDGAPDLFFKEAQALLAHAAAISRILWPPRASKDRRASARGTHLRDVLGIAEDHPLRTRTLRDHLEHFDERLDQWAEQSAHGGLVDRIIGPVTVIRGPSIGRRDFLRAYDPKPKVFTFRGDEFDIQKLVAGVEEVKNAATRRAHVLRVQNS
jgi:uncharacterized protein YcaQ